MGVSALDLRERTAFTSAGKEYVFLVRESGGVIVPSVCPHRGGPINLGACDDTSVVCPWHHTRMRLPATGGRRAPHVFVRNGPVVTIVGPDVDDVRRLSVLEAHRAVPPGRRARLLTPSVADALG